MHITRNPNNFTFIFKASADLCDDLIRSTSGLFAAWLFFIALASARPPQLTLLCVPRSRRGYTFPLKAPDTYSNCPWRRQLGQESTEAKTDVHFSQWGTPVILRRSHLSPLTTSPLCYMCVQWYVAGWRESGTKAQSQGGCHWAPAVSAWQAVTLCSHCTAWHARTL